MHTKRGVCQFLILLFLTAAASFSGFSQSTTLLRGTLTDPQGAVITNAKVTLSNAGTGFTRSVTTDARGEYQFVPLAPGTYKIVVEMAGFTTVTRTDVQLLVNTPTTLDLRVELGTATQTVDVAAELSTVNTIDASVGNAFSELQVRELPLETRNVVQLLNLQPGATTNGEVLGVRRDQNNITLDGVDVNDNQNAGLMAQNTTTGNTCQVSTGIARTPMPGSTQCYLGGLGLFDRASVPAEKWLWVRSKSCPLSV